MRAVPEWRDFEEAVARFAAAMDPSASVRHNVFLPDADTRHRRQRDVWIEANLCGLFPVVVHVSCKKLKRKLHEGDLDTFIGELSSSRAHKGVLYSYSGFSKPAIEKAKARGICCCKLYAGAPADLPEVLLLDAYCCSSQIQLSVSPYPAHEWDLRTWQDLFDIQVQRDGSNRTVLDEIVAMFHDEERSILETLKVTGQVPRPFEVASILSDGSRGSLNLVARGRWKFHKARLEAFLLNGSYSFTSERFVGQFSTPWIDRLSVDPGPGWDLVPEPPGSLENVILCIRYQGNLREALLEHQGPLPFDGG